MLNEHDSFNTTDPALAEELDCRKAGSTKLKMAGNSSCELSCL